MSSPATPRVPARLRLSGRISLSEISSDPTCLQDIWGGVFYHASFVTAARNALGLTGQTSSIICDGEEIGFLNLLVRKRPVIRAATTPLLFQYFGPVLINDTGDGRLSDLDGILSNKIDFAHFSMPPATRMTFDLPGKWQISQAQTPVVSEDDLAKWGKGFGDDVRNKINKARRSQIRIKTDSILPEKLWSLAFSRRGINPPVAPAKLSGWCDALVKSNLLRIYIAELDGETVAFRGELVYGRYAYDWIAGSDPVHHSSGANQLLMAEIGNELSGLKLSAWDLVGSEIQSIADFKRSFGAKNISYFHARRSFGLKGKLFEFARTLRHA